MQIDRSEQVSHLVNALSFDEIRDLAFEFGVRFEDFGGESKSSKLRELIIYLDRRQILGRFLYFARVRRPDLNWDKYFPIDSEATEQSVNLINFRHLSIYLPVPSFNALNEFLMTLNHALRPLDFIYSFFATILTGNWSNVEYLLKLAGFFFKDSALDSGTHSEFTTALAYNPPSEVLQQAFQAAEVSEDRVAKARILSILAPFLPEEKRTEILQQALIDALVLQDEKAKAWTLIAVAPYMPETAYQESQSLQSDVNRANVLISLAPHLPQAVLQAAQGIQSEIARSRVLSVLAPHLPESEQAKVTNQTSASDDHIEQVLQDLEYERKGTIAFEDDKDLFHLRVATLHYGSPVSVDLLGIAGAIEEIRNLVKDLAWRGSHEKEMATLTKEEKKLQLEQMKLENDARKVEILMLQIDATERLLNTKLEPLYQDAVIAILRPQINLLMDAPVRPQVDEHRNPE